MTARLCRMDGCPNPRAHYRTICETHKSLFRYHGDPDAIDQDTVDELDVDIACYRREPIPGLTRAERRIVSRRLTDAGLSAAEIARILCVATRSIQRYRSETRAA